MALMSLINLLLLVLLLLRHCSLLADNTAKAVACTCGIVVSMLDYCNALLLPSTTINVLQPGQSQLFASVAAKPTPDPFQAARDTETKCYSRRRQRTYLMKQLSKTSPFVGTACTHQNTDDN